MSDQIDQKVLHYFDGEMSPEERASFELELESNEELKKAVSDHKKMVAFLVTNDKEKAREEFKTYFPQELNNRRKRWVWTAAASVIITITCGIALFKLIHKDKTNFFVPYSEVVTFRNNSSQNTIYQLYEEGKYQNFKNDLLSNKKSDLTYTEILMIASAYYMLEKKDSAFYYFDMAILLESEMFTKEGQWYKALALLDSHREEEAKKILRELINKKSLYQSKADSLLKKL